VVDGLDAPPREDQPAAKNVSPRRAARSRASPVRPQCIGENPVMCLGSPKKTFGVPIIYQQSAPRAELAEYFDRTKAQQQREGLRLAAHELGRAGLLLSSHCSGLWAMSWSLGCNNFGRSLHTARAGSFRFIPMRPMRPHAAPCGPNEPPSLPVISQLGRPIGPYWPANWRY
jgi:hypothetical protein